MGVLGQPADRVTNRSPDPRIAWFWIGILREPFTYLQFVGMPDFPLKIALLIGDN